MKIGNTEYFDAPPAHVDYVAKDGETKPETLCWSGSKPIPAVGTAVQVGLNGLGPGTVIGYFSEHGWLGVLVHLLEPPVWWIKQNADLPVNVPRAAHLFGAELRGFR